jgi:hypothetical protein
MHEINNGFFMESRYHTRQVYCGVNLRKFHSGPDLMHLNEKILDTKYNGSTNTGDNRLSFKSCEDLLYIISKPFMVMEVGL